MERPWIIATLPGRSATDCRIEAVEALGAGADMAEVRLDRWPRLSEGDVASLFPTDIRLVATYRSRTEGGEGSDDPRDRFDVLALASRHPFWAVDRELLRDGPEPASEGGGAIWSVHLPAGATCEEARRWLGERRPGGRFVKVVWPASVSEALDLAEALPAQGFGGEAVLHTTGPSGNLFRALGRDLGLAAVYGALPSRSDRPAVEPSQIPVDRLRRAFDPRTPPPIFALLGASVGRSRSPALFSRWFERFADPGLYVGLDIQDVDELRRAVRSLKTRGFRGFNVTRPWKIAALRIVDRTGPAAEACGCANVLTVESDGSVTGENTDVTAVRRRLTELERAGRWDGARALVAGSGGAARAVLSAARSLGASPGLLARDRSVAQAIAREFEGFVVDEPDDRPFALVVNATSIGVRSAGPPDFDLARWLAPGGLLLDLVYDPELPWLGSMAQARGASYEDGRRLLVYQAAETYRLWRGREIPDEEIESACRAFA